MRRMIESDPDIPLREARAARRDRALPSARGPSATADGAPRERVDLPIPQELIGLVIQQLEPADVDRLGATSSVLRSRVQAEREHADIRALREVYDRLTDPGGFDPTVPADRVDRLRRSAHHLRPEEALRLADALFPTSPMRGNLGAALGALIGRRDRAEEARTIALRMEQITVTPLLAGALPPRTGLLVDVLCHLGPASEETYRPFIDRLREEDAGNDLASSWLFLPEYRAPEPPQAVRDAMATVLLETDRIDHALPSTTYLFRRLRMFTPTVRQAILDKALELRDGLADDPAARSRFVATFTLHPWGTPQLRDGLQGVPAPVVQAWRDFGAA